MLVLTRKPGQAIIIRPDATLCLATPIGQLFTEGPIALLVTRVDSGSVRLGIKAHPALAIYRVAALDSDDGDSPGQGIISRNRC